MSPRMIMHANKHTHTHTYTHKLCMAASTYDITVASQKDRRVRASQADVIPFTQCQLRNHGVQRLQDRHAVSGVFLVCDRMPG